ncbi:cytochrome c biogenesis protein CcsA [Runella slithyformis]|uniref:Cytochrome c assembly protein n=1 Tax=Runella slithyformis (strain ATCC 29530 / DSM 19594 / LMG 11500 / NCIMB 11436 / LSU 4) TaxID=761193 RepID=A0A7U3ZLW1_RUNSL|nr:cytochrome c biogenesis protein CcsA [Runella slithyformis]AEI49582.1 cytochrome c assembly protein [Runella slithyformis DSM 19594]
MTLGNLGHLLVILSFVMALVATYAYLRATLLSTDNLQVETWKRFARGSFYIHAAAVIGVCVTLYVIIYGHHFEYHYAWSHSSRALPWYYMLSCFWEGQEGSFMLWMFWQAVLGVILIRTNKLWEAPMMTVYALVQAFLTSMILGVIIPGFDFKIGSTPFLTIAEANPDAPFLQLNPDFIPKDGNGLNPLLQNYWMVIHPPTLFLGFALTLVPFAYLMAGLWRKQVVEWLRPALPWTLLTGVVLGVGILMGGYWAYETLSFNSYWSWDPVENAVYVPWLIVIAALHTMIIAKKNATALKTSVILIIAQFILILYSTFLTRSGILGNASVHSFTDLGLSGQLLLYLFAFIIVAIVLSVRAWKLMPSDKDEVSTYSREFWLFMGATVLCLASFQVIIPTSIPVWNSIVEAFGGVSKLAPPTDAITYYTKFQLWFFSVIAILSGIGQYFWWKRVQKGKMQELLTPLWISLFISALLITFGGINKLPYIALLTAGVFAMVSNMMIIIGVLRGSYRVSGGSVTHIGVALMLLGILWSSGYQKVVSLNASGLLISKDDYFTKEDNKENKENVLLWLGQPTRMGEYMLTYRGPRIEIRDVPEFVPNSWVDVIEGDFHAVCLRDITLGEKTYHKKGDTVAVYAENAHYEVEYREPNGRIATLYPRVQFNEKMGLVTSPDIKRELNKDLYSYVTVGSDPKKAEEWSPTENFRVAMQDTFFVNDFVAVLESVGRTDKVEGIALTPNDVAVKAQIKILDKEREYFITPTFAINQDRMVLRKPEVNEDLGLRVQFMEIDPKTGTFSFAVNSKQRDYIVMKAVEKPLINVLWIGTLVLIIGFTMSTLRRFREFRLIRDKGVELEKV